jgi:hypothetical protein
LGTTGAFLRAAMVASAMTGSVAKAVLGIITPAAATIRSRRDNLAITSLPFCSREVRS